MNSTRVDDPSAGPATPLICGALRLGRDSNGRITSGTFLRDGVPYGPVFTTQPKKKEGTFRGAGRDESYLGNTWWRGSGWSGINYERWVTLCHERLQHLAIECRWQEANRALAEQRWDEAAVAYAQVASGWNGCWLGDEHDDKKRLALEQQIIATLATQCASKQSTASAEVIAHLAQYVDLCEDERPCPFVPLLDCLGALLTPADVERVIHDSVVMRLEYLLRDDAARMARSQENGAVSTPSRLAYYINERWKTLTACAERMKFPVTPAFLTALAEHAAQHPEIARLHAWYTSQDGRLAEAGAAHIELAKKSDARIEDLNNAVQAHLVGNRLDAAQALLAQAEHQQRERGWVVLPSRNRQLLMDEYYFQHHQATLFWLQKNFPAALIAAERCLLLENQLIDNARIPDPFSNAVYLKAGGFTSAGVWAVITALTALKRYAEAYGHFRTFLGDAPLMTIRLAANRTSTEWVMLAAWCLYEEGSAASATADQDWAESFALMRARLPDPRQERISHTYACFAACFGLHDLALDYVRAAIEQGTSITELRESTSLFVLAKDPRFEALLLT